MNIIIHRTLCFMCKWCHFIRKSLGISRCSRDSRLQAGGAGSQISSNSIINTSLFLQYDEEFFHSTPKTHVIHEDFLIFHLLFNNEKKKENRWTRLKESNVDCWQETGWEPLSPVSTSDNFYCMPNYPPSHKRLCGAKTSHIPLLSL